MARRGSSSLRLEEGEQVGVDLVRLGGAHAVREIWIDLQLGILDDLRGLQTCRADRDDLVIVAMQDEGWHVELLEVLRKIRLRESLDAVVVGLYTAQHSLQPPTFADAF